MKHRLTLPSILFFLVASSSVMFTACYPCRKMTFDAKLHEVNQAINEERQLIENIQRLKNEKVSNQSVDSAVSERMDRKLKSFSGRLDSLRRYANVYDSIASNKKDFRKQFKKILITGIKDLSAEVKDTVARSNRTLSYTMMMDLLERAKQNMFNLAAFFGPGEYSIPTDNLALIEQQFGPFIDSVANFSNKYAGVDREIIISFYGYADGQAIAPESNLGQFLSKSGKLNNPNSVELNEVLSELRSKAMSSAFTNLYNAKSSRFKDFEKVTFVDVVRGMGERLPNPKIRDYRQEDERRRIVLFYWGILPK